jgi:hypothetical protein
VDYGKECGAARARRAYTIAMLLPLHFSVTRYPVRMRWFLAGAWMLILAKCVLIWWAIDHWSVPIHPAWVIVPTLLFAVLATGLWLGVHDD